MARRQKRILAVVCLVIAGSIYFYFKQSASNLPKPVLISVSSPITLFILPLGEVSEENIRLVTKAIKGNFKINCQLLDPIAIPKHLYTHKPTKSLIQEGNVYHTKLDSNVLAPDHVLYFVDSLMVTTETLGSLRLDSLLRKRGHYLMVLTEKALTDEAGMYTIRGIVTRVKEHYQKYSIVSSYLVNKQSATRAEYQFRMEKVATHEFIHMFGLHHCQESKYCLMVGVGEGGLTLGQGMSGRLFYQTPNALCASCARQLKQAMKRILPVKEKNAE
jgi:hypothetical protein